MCGATRLRIQPGKQPSRAYDLLPIREPCVTCRIGARKLTTILWQPDENHVTENAETVIYARDGQDDRPAPRSPAGPHGSRETDRAKSL